MNDLILQLRKSGVSQIILAGMAANLCIESHLREFLEQGFEAVVVRGDGYLAAMTNFRFLAHAIWTTTETLAHLKQPALAAA